MDATYQSKRILMSAIRFGYPLQFLESHFKKCLLKKLYSPSKTSKIYVAKIKLLCQIVIYIKCIDTSMINSSVLNFLMLWVQEKSKLIQFVVTINSLEVYSN